VVLVEGDGDLGAVAGDEPVALLGHDGQRQRVVKLRDIVRRVPSKAGPRRFA
jgi:hypothetical protein